MHLEAWAAPLAQRLHDALGDYVELVVGVLLFPQRAPLRPASSQQEIPDPHTDASLVSVSSDGDLVAASGRALHTKLRVTNHSEADLTLKMRSDRTLYGIVIDPHTGEVVNADMRWAPLTADVTASINPGSSLRLDARIPTASCSPAFGYCVPPGDWDVRFRLTPEDALADLIICPSEKGSRCPPTAPRPCSSGSADLRE